MPSALFSGCLHALALIYQSDTWSQPRAGCQAGCQELVGEGTGIAMLVEHNALQLAWLRPGDPTASTANAACLPSQGCGHLPGALHGRGGALLAHVAPG